jgi:hypothetical protein
MLSSESASMSQIRCGLTNQIKIGYSDDASPRVGANLSGVFDTLDDISNVWYSISTAPRLRFAIAGRFD